MMCVDDRSVFGECFIDDLTDQVPVAKRLAGVVANYDRSWWRNAVLRIDWCLVRCNFAYR